MFLEDVDGNQFLAKISPRLASAILNVLAAPNGDIDATPCGQVAFPLGYKVPKGIEVISLISMKHHGIKVGLNGVTIESGYAPYCDWDNGVKRICMMSYNLAPLNLKDHPSHPEFGMIESQGEKIYPKGLLKNNDRP